MALLRQRLLCPAGELTLRHAAPADRPFLRALYATTREQELALTGWDAEQRTAFLDEQFRLQQHGYAERFPGGEHLVVLLDGRSVGTLWIDASDSQVYGVDVALLPECRSLGVGAALVGEMIACGDASGRPVRFMVEAGNGRARGLYERLGFTIARETGTHVLMEREAGQAPTR